MINKPAVPQILPEATVCVFIDRFIASPVINTYYLIADSLVFRDFQGYEASVFRFDGTFYQYQTVATGTGIVVSGVSYKYYPGFGWLDAGTYTSTSTSSGGGGGATATETTLTAVNVNVQDVENALGTTTSPAVGTFSNGTLIGLTKNINNNVSDTLAYTASLVNNGIKGNSTSTHFEQFTMSEDGVSAYNYYTGYGSGTEGSWLRIEVLAGLAIDVVFSTSADGGNFFNIGEVPVYDSYGNTVGNNTFSSSPSTIYWCRAVAPYYQFVSTDSGAGSQNQINISSQLIPPFPLDIGVIGAVNQTNSLIQQQSGRYQTYGAANIPTIAAGTSITINISVDPTARELNLDVITAPVGVGWNLTFEIRPLFGILTNQLVAWSSPLNPTSSFYNVNQPQSYRATGNFTQNTSLNVVITNIGTAALPANLFQFRSATGDGGKQPQTHNHTFFNFQHLLAPAAANITTTLPVSLWSLVPKSICSQHFRTGTITNYETLNLNAGYTNTTNNITTASSTVLQYSELAMPGTVPMALSSLSSGNALLAPYTTIQTARDNTISTLTSTYHIEY
jgi:hypothetical protein